MADRSDPDLKVEFGTMAWTLTNQGEQVAQVRYDSHPDSEKRNPKDSFMHWWVGFGMQLMEESKARKGR